MTTIEFEGTRFSYSFSAEGSVSVKPFNMMMEEQEVSAFHCALVKALVLYQ